MSFRVILLFVILWKSTQLHSKAKIASDKKWGSKAWKALDFKRWGLKPRSLSLCTKLTCCDRCLVPHTGRGLTHLYWQKSEDFIRSFTVMLIYRPRGWKAELTWLADLQRMVYPHKWSPISWRSIVRYGKLAGQTDVLPLCYATNPVFASCFMTKTTIQEAQGARAFHKQRTSHKTVSIVFLANDRCLRGYDLVVAHCWSLF